VKVGFSVNGNYPKDPFKFSLQRVAFTFDLQHPGNPFRQPWVHWLKYMAYSIKIHNITHFFTGFCSDRIVPLYSPFGRKRSATDIAPPNLKPESKF
jgi:hypothetical protein